jgi:hypothetical protein
MNLHNGYKVIYDKAKDNKHVFYASKTGKFADAEKLGEFENGKYKLIYEKAGKFYGSESGIPAEDDYCFTEFDKVFEEGYVEPVEPTELKAPKTRTSAKKAEPEETPVVETVDAPVVEVVEESIVE